MPRLFDQLASRHGYIPKPGDTLEKAAQPREAIAQNPLAQAYQAMSLSSGLRKSSGVTMQTLRRMSRYNWVDRTCIGTLRDEITALPWDIVPIDPHKPYDTTFQQIMVALLNRPNRNNENFRTLWDKILEDILVLDAGIIEKVRNDRGQVVELWYVDGSSIKPLFDAHGVVGEPAYQQFIVDKLGNTTGKPVAEWKNEDMIDIQWNPQGAMDTYGYGLSPVEAGLAVGTAFLYAEAYNLGFFRQNTMPPMLINMGKEVQPDQVTKFQQWLAAEMMGPEGYWKPIIGSFGDGFDVKQLLKAASEMGFKDYVEWQMKWKVALYRMSPQDIGFTLDQYKTEGQVQQQLSQNKAINSLSGVLTDYINREILGDDAYRPYNANLKFAWVQTDAIDPVDQANVDKTYLMTGVKTTNEVRQSQGLDPVSGGDELLIVAGNTVVPLKDVATNSQIQQVGQLASFKQGTPMQKSFSPDEGTIVDLATNQTAICWMDDRGVTQPFFVTDYGKTKGVSIKPAFLDERRDQEPPEQKVAELLRSVKANTPEVQILTYDEVLKLIPDHITDQFTTYLRVEAPFYSKEWLDRWGTTRQSPYYIVTGYLTGTDLGNADLQRAMAATPESYLGAVKDLARVWLAERHWYLGDRKPGHYLITSSGAGFGVDYQFYETQASWEKTSPFLLKTLAAIHPSLFFAFKQSVEDQAADFGMLEKSFGRMSADKGEGLHTLDDIERQLATQAQKALRGWYHRAVHGARVRKALPNAGNPDVLPAFIDGNQVAHPVLGEPAFISHGELLPALLLPLVDALFGVIARVASAGDSLTMPGLLECGSHQDLPTAIALATQEQGEHPRSAYLVAVAPDGMGKSLYRIFCYQFGEGAR